MFFVLLMMRQPPWFTRTGNLFPYQTLIQSNDTLSGGSGRDTFRWGSETSAGEADIIADFESGAGCDVLDVSGLLPGVAPGAGGHELDAYLNVAFDATHASVHTAANGDGRGVTGVTVAVEGADLTGGDAERQSATIDKLLTDKNLPRVYLPAARQGV